MPNLHHLYSHIKKYGSNHQSLYLLGFTIFFFTIFDSIIQYITPLILIERGFSSTAMGLIIGSSSIFGAFFDFLFCRFVKNTTFRRTFLFMILICFVYPIVLWGAKTVWIFMIAMILWGIYYDLYNYGIFDFIARYTKKEEHSSSFGVAQVFRSLAQIVAPVIAGLTIFGFVTFQIISLGWFFLIIASLSFSFLLYNTKSKRPLFTVKRKIKSMDSSGKIATLGKISRIIFPALVMTIAVTVFEAFYWTLGPLYAKHLNLHQFSGLLVTAYSIPAVLLGWHVGAITDKLGKKKTAYITFLMGSLTMTGFFFVQNNAFLAILVTFIVACYLGLSLPAINGAYADYISETPNLESEIEAAQDLFTNIGYIIGPVMAGIMADVFSYHNSFALLGLAGAIVSLLLLKFSPKHINIKSKLK